MSNHLEDAAEKIADECVKKIERAVESDPDMSDERGKVVVKEIIKETIKENL